MPATTEHREGRRRWPRRVAAALLVVACGLAPLAPPATAAGFAGKSLTEALLALQERGLRIVFTSNVVRPEMTVTAEPAATEPRAILDELLAPHRLGTRDGPNGTLIVVPSGAGAGAAGGAIGGRVATRFDDAPLAGVTVRLLETGREVRTGADGGFLIAELTAGVYGVELRRRGFVVERRDGVVVQPGRTTELTIPLDAAPITEEELVVTPSRMSLLRREPRAPLALSRDDMLRLPHLGGDLFRALSLLPGIAANDVSATFHVRGGRADETKIVLDGQELYEPYHLRDYDAALSVVAASTLDSVDLSTGGFAVEHGDRMAGVLDMTTVTPTGKPTTELGIGVLNLNAGSSGTFADQRGSWIAQLRRGSIDLASRLIGRENPVFWDLFTKLDLQLSPRRSLRINALATDDDLEFRELTPETDKRLDTHYRSAYLWLTHQAILTPGLFVVTAASNTRIDRDRRGFDFEEDTRFDIVDRRDLDVVGLRQDWSAQLSDANYLRGGFALRRFDAVYDYRGFFEFDDPLATIRRDPDSGSTVFASRFEADHGSVYLRDRHRLSDDLTVELGLRLDDHSLTDESILSPRLNLAWAPGRRSVVRVAWGRFTQSQRPYELQIEDGESGFFPVERSEHRVVGFEHRFRTPAGGGPALRVELYQRLVSNPRVRYENLYEPINNFPEVEPDRVRVAPERAVAEGIEIFLRGRAGQRTGWWVNYAWASTEDESAGVRSRRQFDQPHTLNANLDRRFGHWTVSLAWRYHTGWPTTPLSLAEVVDEDGESEFAPVLGAPFSARLPDYHRLDLRASRRWQRDAGVLGLFFDVQNVYDRANAAGFDYEIDAEAGTIQANREHWAGVLPSVGVSFEF